MKAFVLAARGAALGAALTLAAVPLAAQTAPPPPSPDPISTDRNFDPNLLIYAGLPALIAIILVLAASTGSDERPASV